MGSQQRIPYGLALQNPLAQRVAEPGRCGVTGRTPHHPPGCGTPARWETRPRCWGGTRREMARLSAPSGAGEPGEDAEPAPPAHLGCAPPRAGGALRVLSSGRGKRLTLQVSELLFVLSASFLPQGLCQDGRCPNRRRALTELWFRAQVE